MESIDTEILISRIESLAKEKGLTPTTVYIESHAGKNFKSNLKTAKPSLGKITLIANYLECSVDYLIGKTDQKEKPSVDGELDELDNEIIKLFSSLSDEKKKAALNYIAFLTQQENGEN